jgi:hypothetical protein
MDKIKNISIIIGFGIASLIASIVYYWALPYVIYYVSFGSGVQEYLTALAPAPLFMLIAGWLYMSGMYFYNQKLINAAQYILIAYIAFAAFLYWVFPFIIYIISLF